MGIHDPAVVITGGYDYDATKSAEIYHPDKDTPCVLPDLPDKREDHTQDGSLMCGGYDTTRSCRKWNPDTGAWDEVTTSLTHQRYHHVSWTPADGSGTYLMGGFASERTSDIIDTDVVVHAQYQKKNR